MDKITPRCASISVNFKEAHQLAPSPDIPEGKELDINTGPIKKLKNGKELGLDDIPPEVLKADPATTADLLIVLLQDIWEKEEVSSEWRTGLII